jgi:hypothetical protein
MTYRRERENSSDVAVLLLVKDAEVGNRERVSDAWERAATPPTSTSVPCADVNQ